MRISVAHIVPSMSHGGVEIGIERSLREMQTAFDYRVFTVRRRGSLKCNQQGVLRLLWSYIRAEWRPTIVITSLWWAHPFGRLFQAFGIRWIAFFHNSKAAHKLDSWVLQWTWLQADARLVDSQTTGEFMTQVSVRPFRVVPYIFAATGMTHGVEQRDIDLVWVGRNARQKRLDLLREFLVAMSKRIRNGRCALIIAGSPPDFVEGLSGETGWDVQKYLSLDHEKVLGILRRSRFYLLFSDFEGMSMSTIEAIQAGCVAVVRPVGEIDRYLDQESAVFIRGTSSDEIDRAADAVTKLWSDSGAQRLLVERAQSKVRALPDYVTAFTAAISAELDGVARRDKHHNQNAS